MAAEVQRRPALDVSEVHIGSAIHKTREVLLYIGMISNPLPGSPSPSFRRLRYWWDTGETLAEREFQSESSTAEIPKRRIPNEGYEANILKRKAQTKDPKQNCTIESFKVGDPKPSSQAKDTKRKFLSERS